jgi:hypothetical protein
MSLLEVIARYAGPADHPDRPVLLLPTAEVIAPRVPAATPWSPEDLEAGPSVLVDLFPAGDIAAQVEDLAPRVGPKDIAVVLVASSADTLPIGPLVSGLTGAGLRAVQVETIRIKEARTVLVVTRDDAVPRRSYLIGTELLDDPSTMGRLGNEWLIEQFQLRALVETMELRLTTLESQVVTLKGERDTALASLATSSRALAVLEATARDQRASIRKLESKGLRRVGRNVSKAARIVKDDPVRGTGRLAKAAGRRLRAH